MTIEGLLAAIAFGVLGVPYAFLLGSWVGMTAIIPNFGAWLGYAPAVLLALSISPMQALITLLICLLNNVLVGNVLGPRIQGQVVQVHPLLVFLAVVAGGALVGIPGVLLAVPTVAVMRVLLDFLRVRVRVREEGPAT
jgi:predicted PurR-regulated permease PerM